MSRAGGLLLLLLMACGGRTRLGSPEIGAAVFSEDVYPRHPVRFPGGVTGVPDVAYTSEPGFRPPTLDLYLPPASLRGPRPFVVYVHGGGWIGGSTRTTGTFRNWPEVLAQLAARGYVVASISYRLAREAPFPAAIHDVKSAIRWLRVHADTYDIDERRGLIWGPSAGGQLAALAAVSCGVAELDPPARETGANNGALESKLDPPPSSVSACLQGAVSWYGVSDFSTFERPEAALYLACESPDCSPEQLARMASPVTHVDPTDPPVLFIHGSADRTVPHQQARKLYDLLRADGVEAELLTLPGIDHSFLGATPAATRDANLTALRRTFEFIDRTIGPASTDR